MRVTMSQGGGAAGRRMRAFIGTGPTLIDLVVYMCACVCSGGRGQCRTCYACATS